MSGGYSPFGNAQWKAPVLNSASLPPTGNAIGDTRVETTQNGIYTWNGSAWVCAGSLTVGSSANGITVAAANAFQVTDVVVTADSSGSLNSKYWLFNTLNTAYYVWYDNGGGTDPAIPGRTGVHVIYTNNANLQAIRGATATALTSLSDPDFSVVTPPFPSQHLVITLTGYGPVADASSGNIGFSVSTTTQGAIARQLNFNPQGVIGLFNPSPTDGTIILDVSSPIAYTIDSLAISTASGTLTAAVQINGTSVTGLASVSVSSSLATPSASGANSVNPGDQVTLVISSSASPVNLAMNLVTTAGQNA